MSDLAYAMAIFESQGFKIDGWLKRLALAWDFANLKGQDSDFGLFQQDNDERRYLEIVPEASVMGIDDDKNPDTTIDEDGNTVYESTIKRPYIFGNFVGPTKPGHGWDEQKKGRMEKDWSNRFVLLDLDDERGAL